MSISWQKSFKRLLYNGLFGSRWADGVSGGQNDGMWNTISLNEAFKLTMQTTSDVCILTVSIISSTSEHIAGWPFQNWTRQAFVHSVLLCSFSRSDVFSIHINFVDANFHFVHSKSQVQASTGNSVWRVRLPSFDYFFFFNFLGNSFSCMVFLNLNQFKLVSNKWAKTWVHLKIRLAPNFAICVQHIWTGVWLC